MRNQISITTLLAFSILVTNAFADEQPTEMTSFRNNKLETRWNHKWVVTGENYLNCIAAENACCFKVGIVTSTLSGEYAQKTLTFIGETTCGVNISIKGENLVYAYDDIQSQTGTALQKGDFYFGDTLHPSYSSPIFADEKSDVYTIKLPSDKQRATKDKLLNVLVDAYEQQQESTSTSALLSSSFLFIMFSLFV